MPVLFAGLESAFERFGGVPRELLFDQMTTVVTSDDRSSGGGLVVNAEFLRFAAHWGFLPRSCRLRYVRESFFYGRTFINDADLNEQADRWVEGTANVRVHGTTRERPLDRFERDEREALRPLALQAYRRPGGRPSAAKAPRPAAAPTVHVQRRPLREYSEAVR